MTAHAVKWTAPYPLWSDMLTGPGADKMHFGQPRILRFADDSFMEQFLAVLERHPSQIQDFEAIPETWQEPAPTPKVLSLLEPVEHESKLARSLKRLRVTEERFGSGRILKTKPATDSKPLKLFHPAHQRFYLVTASLVCGLKGLTDHKIDSGHQERIGFVIRRLMPPEPANSIRELPDTDPLTWDEYAFVAGTEAPGWRKIIKMGGGEIPRLMAGEEQLPLFPMHYTEDDARKRRILAGVVPVGKREAYMGAMRSSAPDPLNPAAATARPKTARVVLFRTQVAEPWKSLIGRAGSICKLLKDSESETGADPAGILKAAREQIQVVSWYILLDLAKYLQKYLRGVWQVVLDPVKGEADLESDAEKNLFRALCGPDPDQEFRKQLTKGTGYFLSDVKGSLRDALRVLGDPKVDWENLLDTVIDVYDRSKSNPKWPPFLLPLADPVLDVEILKSTDPFEPLGAKDDVDSEMAMDAETIPDKLLARVDKLVALVARALPAGSTERTAPLPLAAQKVFDHREGWFVIRCIYERPNCGPLHPAEVSAATVPFQMAGFFDPDAPARPIRIPLPIDTSPAGLRKFDKNTAFMISDMLCGQIKRAKGLSLGDLVLSVLPWPFHKDLPAGDGGPCKSGSTQFGMICSLSIPIITICAMILLMIIVSLFDIIFRWLPYFIICFPLPGFKAKKPAGSGP